MGNPWTPGPWSLDESNRIVGADGETLVAEARRFTFEEAARVSADRRLQTAAPEMADELAENVRRLSILRNELTGRIEGEAAHKFFGVVDTQIARHSSILARIRGDEPCP